MVFICSSCSNLVGVSMVVRYPPTYPDDVPNISFVDYYNLSEDSIIMLTQSIYVSTCCGKSFLGSGTRVRWNGDDLQPHRDCKGMAD